MKSNTVKLLHYGPKPTNGEVERQNWSLLKSSMKIAQAEGKDWRKELVYTTSQPIEQRQTVLPESARQSRCLAEEYAQSCQSYAREQ